MTCYKLEIDSSDTSWLGISLEHLKLLTESPNFNIANAATGLVVDRFMRDGDAYRSFMRDLHSEDEATRHRARLTRDFLRTWPAKSGHILPRYPPSRSDSGRSLSDGGDLTDEESRLHDGEANLLYDGEINVVIPSDDDPVAGWTNVPRERPTADEAERRRRRREAMVLRESEGGVEESDIIRPHLSG